MGVGGIKHAGQKRTHRSITGTYAFLPREAVTKFLSSCVECQNKSGTHYAPMKRIPSSISNEQNVLRSIDETPVTNQRIATSAKATDKIISTVKDSPLTRKNADRFSHNQNTALRNSNCEPQIKHTSKNCSNVNKQSTMASRGTHLKANKNDIANYNVINWSSKSSNSSISSSSGSISSSTISDNRSTSFSNTINSNSSSSNKSIEIRENNNIVLLRLRNEESDDQCMINKIACSKKKKKNSISIDFINDIASIENISNKKLDDIQDNEIEGDDNKRLEYGTGNSSVTTVTVNVNTRSVNDVTDNEDKTIIDVNSHTEQKIIRRRLCPKLNTVSNKTRTKCNKMSIENGEFRSLSRVDNIHEEIDDSKWKQIHNTSCNINKDRTSRKSKFTTRKLLGLKTSTPIGEFYTSSSDYESYEDLSWSPIDENGYIFDKTAPNAISRFSSISNENRSSEIINDYSKFSTRGYTCIVNRPNQNVMHFHKTTETPPYSDAADLYPIRGKREHNNKSNKVNHKIDDILRTNGTDHPVHDAHQTVTNFSSSTTCQMKTSDDKRISDGICNISPIITKSNNRNRNIHLKGVNLDLENGILKNPVTDTQQRPLSLQTMHAGTKLFTRVKQSANVQTDFNDFKHAINKLPIPVSHWAAEGTRISHIQHGNNFMSNGGQMPPPDEELDQKPSLDCITTELIPADNQTNYFCESRNSSMKKHKNYYSCYLAIRNAIYTPPFYNAMPESLRDIFNQHYVDLYDKNNSSRNVFSRIVFEDALVALNAMLLTTINPEPLDLRTKTVSAGEENKHQMKDLLDCFRKSGMFLINIANEIENVHKDKQK